MIVNFVKAGFLFVVLVFTGCNETYVNKDNIRIATGKYYEECYQGYIVVKHFARNGVSTFYKLENNKQVPCDMQIKYKEN